MSGKIVPILIEPELDIRFVGTRPVGYLREIENDRISFTAVSVGVNMNAEESIQVMNGGHLYDFKLLLDGVPLRCDVEMRMLTDKGADEVLFRIADCPLLLDEFIAIYAPPWTNVQKEHICVFLRLSKRATEGKGAG